MPLKRLTFELQLCMFLNLINVMTLYHWLVKCLPLKSFQRFEEQNKTAAIYVCIYLVA